MMFRTGQLLILVLTALFPAVHASASELGQRLEIAGPVSARIIRVIDGDTLLVAARPWPQQTMEVYVRLRGIDAPELKSSCPSARHAGKQAQEALADLTRDQSEIQLSHISGDKYFGRVLADISFADGRNPAQEMLLAGYVVPYEGGRKAKGCASSVW
jgi:micrococcal nuclease